MKAAAVLALVLLAPRPAGAACSGTALRFDGVWPPSGSVPANLQVVVSYCGATAFAEDVRAIKDVMVRPLGGAAVAASVRELAGGDALTHAVLVVPAAELPVGADVEVVARLAAQPVATYRVVAADHVAPVLGGSVVVRRGDAGVALELPAVSEDVRWTVSSAGAPVAELASAPPGDLACGAALEVRAVDRAGNSSDVHTVVVDCGGSSVGCEVGGGGSGGPTVLLVGVLLVMVQRRT